MNICKSGYLVMIFSKSVYDELCSLLFFPLLINQKMILPFTLNFFCFYCLFSQIGSEMK